MNKNISIIITIPLVIGLGFIFIKSGTKPTGNNNTVSNSGSQNSSPVSVENSVIKDGIQYITIDAKGGYSPRSSNAKAGIPTKLIVKTNGTYDCSASLVIRSLGFQKILAQTGEEVIDIGTPKAGVPLQGVCGMGMYNFLVNFS
jgi:plastocyanin domain-containing protein